MAEEYDNLTLFAAIKTLHAQGNDLLSAICSLVLQCIESGESIEELQRSFRDSYLTDIPLESVKTVLKRLKSDHLIEYDTSFTNIRLSDSGRAAKNRLHNSIRGLRRDFAALVDNMRAFYKSKKYSNPKNFEQELLLFIDQNIGYTSGIMRGIKDGTLKNATNVAEYFAHLEKTSPEKFKLLQNIFFGRVYINIIKTRDAYSKDITLNATNVYLDTNLLLSILGFHDDSSTKQAKELLDILRSTQKIEILVFDETVIEARQLLQSAGKQMARYNNKIPVDSIYYKLKILGHTKESITILMENLEENILRENIKIVPLPIIDESTSEYQNFATDVSSTAAKLDRAKAGGTLRHDVRVLCAVKSLRQNMNSKLFEKSQQLFVTPDIAINTVTHSLAKKELKYPLSVSVTEIVSTLWMRNLGDDKIANNIVRQSIMAYVRERAISHDLWEKFMTTVEEAAQQKHLSKDDIAVLMSDEDTSRILAQKQYDAPEQLVSDAHIRSIRKTRENDLMEKVAAVKTIDIVSHRIDSFSEIIAEIFVVCMGVVISILLTAIVFKGIQLFGLDNISNGWAILVVVFLVIFALVFGVQVKLSHLINFRNHIKQSTRITVSKKARKVLGLDGSSFDLSQLDNTNSGEVKYDN